VTCCHQCTNDGLSNMRLGARATTWSGISNMSVVSAYAAGSGGGAAIWNALAMGIGDMRWVRKP
jgi:hypothetical protein